MKLSYTYLGLGLFLAVLLLVSETHAHYDRVLLTEVQTLTLFKDRYTTARRTSPVPQLKCIGSYELCQAKYQPSAVQCYNMGTDGVDVQWRCDAELDKDVAFDAVHISCEGFLDRDDPYVLEGSCGLEYKLKFTSTYHEKLRETRENQAAYRRANSAYTTGTPEQDGGEGFKWFILLCAVILGVIWCTKKKRVAEPPKFEARPVGVNPSGPPMEEQPSRFTRLDPTTAAGLGFVAGAATGAAASHVIHSHHKTTEYQHPPTSSYSSSPSYATSRSSHRDSSPTHTSKGFGTSSKR